MHSKGSKFPKHPRAVLGTWLGLLGFGLVANLTSAQAQNPPGGATAEAVTASKETSAPAKASEVKAPKAMDYTISAEDLLDIYVLDVPEISRIYRVSSNGFLSLPLLSQPLPAAGLTMEQLSTLIANKFREAGMLNNAQVTVTLKETRLHTVFVSGAVKRPQGYTIYGPTRLFDLIMEAGGPSDDAGDDAVITRGEEGMRAEMRDHPAGKADPLPKENSFKVEIRKLLQTGEGEANVLLYPGDRVIVNRASMIYILGAVGRPGGYVLSANRENYTVLKVVALAGGFTPVAKEKNIMIFRKNAAAPEGKRDEISVNFNSIVSGKKNDMKLMTDDILYVPESGIKKTTRTALSTAVGAGSTIGTGLIIYRP